MVRAYLKPVQVTGPALSICDGLLPGKELDEVSQLGEDGWQSGQEEDSGQEPVVGKEKQGSRRQGRWNSGPAGPVR